VKRRERPRGIAGGEGDPSGLRRRPWPGGIKSREGERRRESIIGRVYNKQIRRRKRRAIMIRVKKIKRADLLVRVITSK
jgi:hypothetical protein